ncbi:GNAT family N-acetyltransferase [Paenibacillus sp. IB182496]|uniref:GNAT family N-acetyltransferase n=1 Tax=Paenibacillus sabuli TaxID=2772509 RepID=A0A927GQ84_9BACL|nr:GNAT family N-acetyltransferase [Paenibacillus sabuli]MBD2844259.1 GNAT family N-acetyltransferase [Paenibacillus sabuli]
MATKARLIVREAARTDDAAIERVLLDAYRQYEQSLPLERWVQYKHNIVSSVISDTVKYRLVAELDGELAGSVFLFASSREAYGTEGPHIDTPILRLLAVAPAARGKGVATELLRTSAQVAEGWGAQALHLHTTELMGSAVRLYERLGFARAVDKDIYNGELLVRSYRIALPWRVPEEADRPRKKKEDVG